MLMVHGGTVGGRAADRRRGFPATDYGIPLKGYFDEY